MSSALAASDPQNRFSGRRQAEDAVVLRLVESIDATLRKGVAAVYGVLTQRGQEFLGHAIETACRRLKSQLPDPHTLSATAIQFRVVPIGKRQLGVEAALLDGDGIRLGANAKTPLALINLDQSFAALTGL